jgi:hypothetical protein
VENIRENCEIHRQVLRFIRHPATQSSNLPTVQPNNPKPQWELAIFQHFDGNLEKVKISQKSVNWISLEKLFRSW